MDELGMIFLTLFDVSFQTRNDINFLAVNRYLGKQHYVESQYYIKITRYFL